MKRPLHPDLVEVALGHASGSTFERFAQDFFAALLDGSFAPLGGTGDGGADGLVYPPVFERQDQIGTFMQVSIAKNVETRIRRTVERLRDVGRTPTRLLYVAPHRVRQHDLLADRLGNELRLIVTIYDGSFILAYVNHSSATLAAFHNHLEHLTKFLEKPGAANVIAASVHARTPNVYVFLRQELEHRGGNTALLDAVADSLILWALEGTDPVAKVFRSEDEVRDAILETVPAGKSFVEPLLRRRLDALSTKSRAKGSRQIHHHRTKGYCLPYQTRRVIGEENAADEALRVRVRDGFAARILQADSAIDEELLGPSADIAMTAMQLAFESQGLELSGYLTGRSTKAEPPSIADGLDAALQRASLAEEARRRVGTAVFGALQGVFYGSTGDERLYFEKLSRTYSLLFMLNADPHLVTFFQEMAGDFNLYVGSDLLVRCLAERYLPHADQTAQNMLKMLSEAGATLMLAEPVVDEVAGHLRACDYEYRNKVQPRENEITIEVARHIPRLLLRACACARLRPAEGVDPPESWADFVDQFCDYKSLHREDALTQLRRYLLNEFAMSFEATDELEALVDPGELMELTAALESDKDRSELARNDALLALAVYGKRAFMKEAARASEFGYKTWWLTHETKILHHTDPLTRRHEGARYMMRPEFLLNYLALAPTAAEARSTYGNIFPSLLGISLGRRMDEEQFDALMEKLRQAQRLEPARLAAALAQMSDELKGDFSREYARRFST